jgi:outer membrane protein, heavy metal efflux system
MSVRLAAQAAWVAALLAAHAAAAADSITLDDAFARVADGHPELLLMTARSAALGAERDRAALPPAASAGLQVENAAGTGVLQGMQGADITLTLASVLERGGKLDARRVLAQSRIDALAVEREKRRLDLLAEVARRYLAASAAIHQRNIATRDVEQRHRAESTAREQLRAGAAPESVVLMAQSALALAELSQERAQMQWLAAREQLASMWGDTAPQFEIVAGNPLVLPDVASRDALTALLLGTPELLRFVDEQRIAEARLQLARTAATPDLEWQLGVRHVGNGDDLALVAGVTLPLNVRRRADPEIRAAHAERGAVEIQREAILHNLRTTLLEAHARYRLAQLEVTSLQARVLPLLERAESAAERAWRAGASGHLEWLQLQSELTATHRRQLEVAVDAQRALIEIQRLTGQANTASPTAQGTTP